MYTTNLLNKQYDRLDARELSIYIRDLRHTIMVQCQQLNFLTKTETYLPKIDTPNYPYDDEEINEVKPAQDYVAVTMTLDPRKFPQLMFTPEHYQEKYFKQIISHLIYTDQFNAVYGSFEKHCNGNIHCHFIAPLYNTLSNIKELEAAIKPYLTERANNNKAVLVKPAVDVSGWLKYINKPANYKTYFSYNMVKKNSLDL